MREELYRLTSRLAPRAAKTTLTASRSIQLVGAATIAVSQLPRAVKLKQELIVPKLRLERMNIKKVDVDSLDANVLCLKAVKCCI